MHSPVSTLFSSATSAASALALITLAAGCSSTDKGPAAPAPVADAAPEVDPITKLTAGTWNEVPGAEGTACSDGSKFSFFVRPGTVNRVVVEFSGGGACWDALTCAYADGLFSKTVDPTKLPWAGAKVGGIYDHERADNPFKDWHHVFVPYCTGDVHWGENENDYGGAVIKHFGARNARSALAWLYANLAAPEKVMTTGCSAGGYGSIMWAPYVRQHYASAKHYQFSDSAAGAITDTFFDQIATSWKFAGALPSFVPGMSDASQLRSLAALYTKIGAFYPDMPLSQFNTRYDEI